MYALCMIVLSRNRHVYDMEDVFVVAVNVTDFMTWEVMKLKMAINERGCIYPSITIEDEGKVG